MSKPNPHSPLKLGLIGTGNRMTHMHFPVLEKLSESYTVVGCYSPSESSRREFTQNTGVPSFNSVDELVRGTAPDALLVSVHPTRNENVADDLLDLGIPLLLETPLAWSARTGNRLVRKAMARTTPIFVLEQFPYLPIEAFKKQLLDSGVIGRPYAASMDLAYFDYHGLSVLLGYFSQGRVVSVSSSRTTFPLSIGGFRPNERLTWTNAHIQFDDGSLAIFNYSSQAATSPIGGPRRIVIYGDKGFLTNDLLVLRDTADTASESRIIETRSPSGEIQHIALDGADIAKHTWSNSWAGSNFNDEQIAVASLLKSVAGKLASEVTRKEYSADFQQVLNLSTSMDMSERYSGKRLPVPMAAPEWILRKLLAKFRSLPKRH